MLLMPLLVGILTSTFSVQPIKASGTVYITSDYTLTQNIYEPIVVLADSIVIDGNGYTIQGTGSGTGIDLSGISNVTIKNTEIKAFEYGIKLQESSNCSVFENTVTENTVFGIYLEHSSNNTFSATGVETAA